MDCGRQWTESMLIETERQGIAIQVYFITVKYVEKAFRKEKGMKTGGGYDVIGRQKNPPLLQLQNKPSCTTLPWHKDAFIKTRIHPPDSEVLSETPLHSRGVSMASFN